MRPTLLTTPSSVPDAPDLDSEADKTQEDLPYSSAIAPVSPGAGPGSVLRGKILRAKGKEAMEIDDGDLGNPVDGLALDDLHITTAVDIGSTGQEPKYMAASAKKKQKRGGHKSGSNTTSIL